MAGVAAVHRDLAVGHLRGRGAAQLLHALDDVRDPEHVRVREQPAVRVERQLARVVMQRVALHERAASPFGQKPMSSICMRLTTVNGSYTVSTSTSAGREPGHRERARAR